MKAKVIFDKKSKTTRLEGITEKELKYIVPLARLKSVFLWETAKINPHRLKVINERLEKGGVEVKVS